MFESVLIANRGAIAVRIARTLREMGVRSVAVYAESDRDSLHVDAADEAHCLGAGAARDTYLDVAKLLRVLDRSGAAAVHPGYGFLSESPEFAETLEKKGVRFIGPRPEQIRRFGLKHEARALAEAARVDLLPGSAVLDDPGHALQEAQRIGYPVMLKSSAGGGGIGMQRCEDPAALERAFAGVGRLAEANFGNAQVFLEKLVVNARHVEVQAFGDGAGGVLVLGDRDCSLQRRHQKVLEECPAPNLSQALRASLERQARSLLESVRYENAGTVEFLVDADAEQAYFLEVNTRLQVEHGVTEEVYGVDLVRWMVEQAAGELPPLEELARSARPAGHAVEARVYAEDPRLDFRPTPGLAAYVDFARGPGLRSETWLRSGGTVSPHFDPMLAKLIARGGSRDESLERLAGALDGSVVHGIETNLAYLRQALELPDFRAGRPTTASLASLDYRPSSFEVLEAGGVATVQSVPGRQGYWAVGVPPSGPMDPLCFRLGNRLLGNDPDAAGLEIVVQGPRLAFHTAATCVVTGAACDVRVDGRPVPSWQTFAVAAGETLSIGRPQGGARVFLLVRGGLRVPREMGSTATFTLGGIGGFAGRALRKGDSVHLESGLRCVPAALAPEQRPRLEERSEIRVLVGPHAAPDFFTDDDMDAFFAADWSVHYHSSRTGVRLNGPQPTWARADGGEAGLHPSNLHDNAYAFGSIDFTGDMPVVLGPDGPSLGGFVCPAVVINADRWKLGQLVAGDRVRFVPVSEEAARRAEREQDAWVESLEAPPARAVEHERAPAVLFASREEPRDEDFAIRRAGQEWLLVEFGPPILDVRLHLRVHAFTVLLDQGALPGIVERTPGIRSLQIRFDTARWTAERLTEALRPLLLGLDVAEATLPSRVVHMPLSWDDPACHEAVGRYVQGVRPDAPWCPDNVEFIRRINGLEDRDEVRRIVYEASYLVMGLGDVYLGAPVATPLDPRHRLVTTKYNPARTWTAENSVGIGGSYLCIYGMEGPGGYQFVGRTLQVWNRHKRGPAFSEHWLLRPFDQIRFHPVSAQELVEMREAFPRGALALEIEETQFDPAAYQRFLAENAQGIREFRSHRDQAFAAELARWREEGLLTFDPEVAAPVDTHEETLEPGATALEAPIAGSVWSLRVADGERVEADQVVAVLEAMKSEFEVHAPAAGTVELRVREGQTVEAGHTLAVVRARASPTGGRV